MHWCFNFDAIYSCLGSVNWAWNRVSWKVSLLVSCSNMHKTLPRAYPRAICVALIWKDCPKVPELIAYISCCLIDYLDEVSKIHATSPFAGTFNECVRKIDLVLERYSLDWNFVLMELVWGPLTSIDQITLSFSRVVWMACWRAWLNLGRFPVRWSKVVRK